MIIVRIWEGLGNQMFQYAYARALREKGADVRLDLGKSYDGVFERFQSDDVRKVSIQNFRLGLPEIHVPAYGKYFYPGTDFIQGMHFRACSPWGLCENRKCVKSAVLSAGCPLF